MTWSGKWIEKIPDFEPVLFDIANRSSANKQDFVINGYGMREMGAESKFHIMLMP